jgi:hypothetical protein
MRRAQHAWHVHDTSPTDDWMGIIVHAITLGTMVHVFLLADNVSANDWNRTEPEGHP